MMMSKRGTTFVRILEAWQRQPGAWEPHGYSGAEPCARLGDAAEVRRLRPSSGGPSSPFRPIEYGDISRGDHLSFTLGEEVQGASSKLAAVGEQALLMGTMRAYLGNIIVTPRAAWLNRRGPLTFAVKSEFVEVLPRDGLVYFWWAYLRSEIFLTKLPVGSGGTRPRLQAEALAATPIDVPDLAKRATINRRLADCAAREWRAWLCRRTILESLS
jgi:hypothetical protein